MCVVPHSCIDFEKCSGRELLLGSLGKDMFSGVKIETVEVGDGTHLNTTNICLTIFFIGIL